MVVLAPGAPHRRGDARRVALLDAAREVFLARGYEGTQMQAVALRAGASKETLYRYFPDKALLFAAVMRTIADRLGAEVPGPDAGVPVRAALEAFGRSFLDGVLQSEALALHRLAIAEAARFPDLGRAFESTGPAAVKRRLAEYLAGATARGDLRCADADHAAALLLGALIADLQLRALLGGFCGTDVSGHVAEAVAMFIARYGGQGL